MLHFVFTFQFLLYFFFFCSIRLTEWVLVQISYYITVHVFWFEGFYFHFYVLSLFFPFFIWEKLKNLVVYDFFIFLSIVKKYLYLSALFNSLWHVRQLKGHSCFLNENYVWFTTVWFNSFLFKAVFQACFFLNYSNRKYVSLSHFNNLKILDSLLFYNLQASEVLQQYFFCLILAS